MLVRLLLVGRELVRGCAGRSAVVGVPRAGRLDRDRRHRERGEDVANGLWTVLSALEAEQMVGVGDRGLRVLVHAGVSDRHVTV